MAALSGVLLGVYLNGISWNTGATLILLMFAAVTLGGLGTANGALIGSLVIGIVADMSSLVIPNDMRYASALAILIIVLLVRPQGIFGNWEFSLTKTINKLFYPMKVKAHGKSKQDETVEKVKASKESGKNAKKTTEKVETAEKVAETVTTTKEAKA